MRLDGQRNLPSSYRSAIIDKAALVGASCQLYIRSPLDLDVMRWHHVALISLRVSVPTRINTSSATSTHPAMYRRQFVSPLLKRPLQSEDSQQDVSLEKKARLSVPQLLRPPPLPVSEPLPRTPLTQPSSPELLSTCTSTSTRSLFQYSMEKSDYEEE